MNIKVFDSVIGQAAVLLSAAQWTPDAVDKYIKEVYDIELDSNTILDKAMDMEGIAEYSDLVKEISKSLADAYNVNL